MRGEPVQDDVLKDFGIERVTIPKASDVLSAQLREMILGSQLRVGDSLPSERELMARSGLSRASVREALRILEVQGFIETRIGRNGGSYVRKPGSEPVTHSLDLLIRGQRVRLQDLLAVREGIEPIAAAQAAVNRTNEDLRQIEQLTVEFERSFNDVSLLLKNNVAWHLAVVRASHNPLFDAFMTPISPAILAATDKEDFKTEEVRSLMLRAHTRVFEAIRDGNPEKARKRMERHVSAYATQMKELEHSAEGR